MKKIFRILGSLTALILGAAAISGCNSLDQTPSNKFTDDSFWASEARAQLVLNMAYNQMYDEKWRWSDESLSDNMIAYRGNPDEYQIRTGQATAFTGIFASTWKRIFQGIKTTNVFVDKINLVPGIADERKTEMLAQIRFIRAYLYFRLTNFYGDVPFFLHDITLSQSREMVRTPKAEVIAALHKELEEIIPQLPSKNELSAAENGRITKAAAMMLDARLYLYDGNFAKVAEICDKLIHNQDIYGSYALFTEDAAPYSAYERMFHSACEYNSEVILDYSSIENTREWNTCSEVIPMSADAFLCSKAPTRDLVNAYLKKDGTKAAENDVNYEGRDPRIKATVVYNGFKWYDKKDGKLISWNIDILGGGKDYFAGPSNNNTPTGYYTRKFYDPDHGSGLKMWANPIIMRYADVLLMYAEAMFETGKMDEAVWNETIRPVRQRAGFDDAALAYPASADEASMRELIRNERRCEFAIEGLRYYDIIRWKAGMECLSGSIKSCAEREMTIATYAFSTRDYLWSVPDAEMNQVPSLRPNNIGY